MNEIQHRELALVLTEEVLDMLGEVLDVPAKPSDSSDTLRWKAARRSVHLELISLRRQHNGGKL